MHFNRLGGFKPAYMHVALILLVLVMVAGCKENIPDDDDVFDNAKNRVADNVLDDITKESEAVLRNLTNLIAALPQICATPLAKLGAFESALPVLGRPDSVVLIGEDDEDTEEGIFFNSWVLSWLNVILGDDDTSLDEDTDTPPVDITLNVRHQTSQLPIPFTLVPQSALLATATVGQPPSLEAGNTEGFFLYQDAPTGVWMLRWRAIDTAKVFSGTISSATFSRVIRRVSEAPRDVVESLEQEGLATRLRFRETTTPTENKGFTFYARPGERISFELRIGPNEDDLEPITFDQLRIGAGDQQLPADQDLEEFHLATNLPMNPTGEPAFTVGAELGTFIWQEVASNTCSLGADQWHVRFSTTGDRTTTFTGKVTAIEDDTSAELTFVSIGNCEDDRQDGGQTLDYTCTLQGAQSAGYDVCVTRGHRVLFTPAVDDVADPRLAFVGSDRELPLAADPLNILFDVDLVERQSNRNLTLADAEIVLSGNNDLDGVLRLNPDQVTLEPLCGRLPVEIEMIIRPMVALTFGPGEALVQPRVRLNGGGDYSTNRFDGSLYTFQEVEFLDEAVDTLDDRRFPDRGRIELRTRLEDEVENTVITAEMDEIEHESGVTRVPIELDINISSVVFEFDDEVVKLSVE
ncbi:MAG: hypothetical protein O7G88_13405 [bacterium]|nr:hypothetical protein [bacterium]